MNAIKNAAFLTVAKACGFAWLAVFCAVFGWMYEPHMAALVGAVMSLLLALVLRFSAWRSLRKPYDRTEMWHYIPKEDRPPAEIAQRVISQVLHDTFQRFARQAAAAGAAMLVVSLGLRAFGITELPNLLPPDSPYAQQPPSLSLAGPPPPALAR